MSPSYSVFLIAAINTFLRFLHFRFGSHYEEYLDCISEQTQKDLIQDENRDTFVHMSSIAWFNLQSSEGRRIALCHIMALLRWHDDREILRSRVLGDPTVVEDSDYSMEDGEGSEYDV